MLIQGKIGSVEKTNSRKPQLLCSLQDGTRDIFLRFFHFTHTLPLKPGNTLRCYGEVRYGPHGFEMVHPDFILIPDGVDRPLEKTLSPVYPTTQGLSQRFWRKVLSQALMLLKENPLPEYLPDSILKENQLLSFYDAIHTLHAPPQNAKLEALSSEHHPAKKRLIFEELLSHQLSLRYARESIQHHHAQAYPQTSPLLDRFIQLLPFQLTTAQTRVVRDILNDLAKPIPMLRLVQGDVGSGKTVVAALCATRVLQSGGQVAIMAPTEILANQHFQHFSRWLSALGFQVGLLHGKTKTRERRELLAALEQGSLQCVVGTHALFQDEVKFKQLTFLIIDEQHRFGVHQRLALRNKGIKNGLFPHQLIMTATPIPRTLAMCAYADLDSSVIDELPPGRKPITTVVIDNQRREEVIARIAHVCQSGRQVYWVCTLIEESDALQAKAASDAFELLSQLLPQLKIALIHGRLSQKEKDEIMQSFKQNDIQLLVATTVIEVGVDVPNASLMIIENAERLGLSQLHQLRGRIGRGEHESHCVLLYQTPLSQTAKLRLKTLRESQDGFFIAAKDLELRGPGEFLGVRQTGDMTLRIADLTRDAHHLPTVQKTAIFLIQHHPENARQIHSRWLENSQEYSQA